jgi:hypothetical protein
MESIKLLDKKAPQFSFLHFHHHRATIALNQNVESNRKCQTGNV